MLLGHAAMSIKTVVCSPARTDGWGAACLHRLDAALNGWNHNKKPILPICKEGCSREANLLSDSAFRLQLDCVPWVISRVLSIRKKPRVPVHSRPGLP